MKYEITFPEYTETEIQDKYFLICGEVDELISPFADVLKFMFTDIFHSYLRIFDLALEQEDPNIRMRDIKYFFEISENLINHLYEFHNMIQNQ